MKSLFYILPVLAGIFFGSAGAFIRILSANGFDVATIVAQRAFFAVIMLLIMLLIYDRSLLIIKIKDLWIFAVTGVIGITLMNILYNVAMKEMTMSLVAVLLSMSPIGVLAVSAVFFKEKLTGLKCLCSILAIVGCYMVSNMPGILSVNHASTPGILAGIATPVFYSLYGIGSKLAVERGYQALTIAFYSILFMVIVLCPFADWGTVIGYAVSAPLAHCSFMLGHSLFVAALPYMLFTIGIQQIDAGKASLLSSCEPAAAMVFGALLFGERPTLVSVGGLVLATIAICMVCRPDKECR